jgi:hypothetical protein
MSLIQKLFDKDVTHLLTQMEQSISDDGRCVYRGPNGLKCAIGALIDDKVYHPEIEGRTVCCEQVQKSVAESNGFKVEDLTEQGWNILSTLQGVHDGCKPVKWEEQLKVVAEKRNLTMPNLDY